MRFFKVKIQIENRKGLGWSSGADLQHLKVSQIRQVKGEWNQESMVSWNLREDTLIPAKK